VDALRVHENSVQKIIALADKGDKQGALVLLDSLHAAVIEARARITSSFFSGHADTLTDPFSLPAGVYRVHFTTEGFGAVETIVLDGPDSDRLLFNLAPGDASQGASTVYTSQGSRIMIQFSNITARLISASKSVSNASALSGSRKRQKARRRLMMSSR